jgi:hypothetical protein
MVFPIGGKSLLELRIDVDKIHDNCPVMNRISGDFYQTYPAGGNSKVSIRDTSYSNVYLGSWIVDEPVISSSLPLSVEIYGNVRFWKGNHPKTTIKLIVYCISNNSTEQADVVFTTISGTITKYICIKKSPYFRDIELELDMTKSVTEKPLLPTYDTHWHSNRPAELSRRTLTLHECYREAGINLSGNPRNNIIDDSAASFMNWDDDELYDAMATYYSHYNKTLPAWKMWGFLCGKYEKDNVLGIMFDADVRFSSQVNKPQRRGFAVFKNNPLFVDLILNSETPTNEKQAHTMRQYLRTFVHETGHTFNLIHPWKKDNPSSLSWMNYPKNYPYGPNDPRNNEDEYWNNFRFRFDDEELIHMRHGDRESVIMGGDPWSSGGQIVDKSSFPKLSENGSPIEFLLRSKNHFDYMEPIEIELRLKNLLEFPITVDILLNPEYGRVKVFIVAPNGSISQFDPLLVKESNPTAFPLMPIDNGTEGSDRYSETILLTYGKGGFYFSQPGDYQIQAIYQGFENIVIPSNILRIRVRPPVSNEEDNMAYDFFTYQVGMNLYLRGSQSSFLADGKRKLEEIFNLGISNSMNAKIAYILACTENKSFFKIVGGKLEQTHKPCPEKVITITKPAKDYYLKALKAKQKEFNIPYRNIAQTRINAYKQLNKLNDAKEELMDLSSNLVSPNFARIKEIAEQHKSLSDKLA